MSLKNKMTTVSKCNCSTIVSGLSLSSLLIGLSLNQIKKSKERKQTAQNTKTNEAPNLELNIQRNQCQRPHVIWDKIEKEIQQKSNKITEFKWISQDITKFENLKQSQCDEIIFVNPEKYTAEFIEHVDAMFADFTKHQNLSKARQIKFIQLDLSNQEDLFKFEQQNNVKLDEQTIFLLKNKYISNYFQFKAANFMENKEFLFKYFSPLQKLSLKNYQEFQSSLADIDRQDTIIFTKAIKPSQQCNGSNNDNNNARIMQYEVMRNRFMMLSLEKNFQNNKNVHFLFVNDEAAAKKLGIAHSQDGSVFMMKKSTKYNANKFNLNLSLETNSAVPLRKNSFPFNVSQLNNTVNIGLTSFHDLVYQLSAQYQKDNVFSATGFDWFFNPRRNLLYIKIDKNQLQAREITALISEIGKVKDIIEGDSSELKDKFEFIIQERSNLEMLHNNKNDNNNNNKAKYLIVVKDMWALESDHIYQTSTQQSQIEELKLSHSLPARFMPLDDSIAQQQQNQSQLHKYHSFEYIYDQNTEFNKENMVIFLQNIVTAQKNFNSNKLEHYKSQNQPVYAKFSNKIVSSTFKNVLSNCETQGTQQAMMYYSQDCDGCKEYGGFYEEMAKQSLMPQNHNNIKSFNRMNTDKNTLEEGQNFVFTPVFLLFRPGYTQTPLIYRNIIMNRDLLQSHYEAASSFKIIPKGQMKQIKECVLNENHLSISKLQQICKNANII